MRRRPPPGPTVRQAPHGVRGSAAASRSRVVPGRRPVAGRRSAPARARRPSRLGAAAGCVARRRTARRVGQHDVDRRSGACAASTSRWSSGEKPSVSPCCGARLSVTTRRAAAGAQRLGQVGHQQVRHHAGEPGARARGPPSRRRGSRRTASGQAGGSGGCEAHRRAPGPAVVATATWPAHRGDAVGPCRVGAAHLGHDLQRLGRHRQHPAAGAEQPADAGPAPATGSPSSSLSRRAAGCRPAWPASAPSPPNRCCRTSRHRLAPVARRRPARPGPSAGRPAAGRRAPRAAGRSSRRRRPTVTTAVMSVGRRSRSAAARRQPVPAAERDDAGSAARPGAVPSLLPPQVAVHDAGRRTPSPRSQPRRAPRPSRRCGACRRCSRPPASGSACPRAGSPAPISCEQLGVAVEELAGALLAQHVVARPPGPGRSASRSSGTQCGLGRKRTSTTRSASSGRPYLKPKDSTVARSARRRRRRRRPARPWPAQLVDVAGRRCR